MKIAVIQGSSQKDKNELLYRCVQETAGSKGHEIINFGIFPDENVQYSYVETAFLISVLLESRTIDFAVTGCSSGQGMMLACNTFPGILCGYTANPSDAYLFGRINNGNAVSYPLGLNFGWAAELNLTTTLNALFSEPFGKGYPKEDAERKTGDTLLLKHISGAVKKTLPEVLQALDQDFIKKALCRDCVYQYIVQHTTDETFRALLKKYRTDIRAANE
jgi:ribose 5-phosphate isomerase RpiB